MFNSGLFNTFLYNGGAGSGAGSLGGIPFGFSILTIPFGSSYNILPTGQTSIIIPHGHIIS
jgi:hypothetical protein